MVRKLALEARDKMACDITVFPEYSMRLESSELLADGDAVRGRRVSVVAGASVKTEVSDTDGDSYNIRNVACLLEMDQDRI